MNNTFYPEHQYFLAHYGVLGMRWGHRKDQYYVGSGHKRRRNKYPPVDKSKVYNQYQRDFDRGMQNLKYKNKNKNKNKNYNKNYNKSQQEDYKNIKPETSSNGAPRNTSANNTINNMGVKFNKHDRKYQQDLKNRRTEFQNKKQKDQIQKTQTMLDETNEMLSRKNKEFWTQTDIKDLGKVAAEKKEMKKHADSLNRSLFKQKAALEAREAAASTIINAIPNLPPLQDNYIDLTYKGHPVATINTGDIVKFGLTSAFNIYQIVNDANHRYK